MMPSVCSQSGQSTRIDTLQVDMFSWDVCRSLSSYFLSLICWLIAYGRGEENASPLEYLSYQEMIGAATIFTYALRIGYNGPVGPSITA